jgi:hypothetical protein
MRVNRLGDTTNGGAYPAGQTLVQSPKFRQTAPEIRDCPGFAAYFGTPPPITVEHPAQGEGLTRTIRTLYPHTSGTDS